MNMAHLQMIVPIKPPCIIILYNFHFAMSNYRRVTISLLSGGVFGVSRHHRNVTTDVPLQRGSSDSGQQVGLVVSG